MPDGKPVDYDACYDGTKWGVDTIYYFKPSGNFRVVCEIVSHHSTGEFIFIDLNGSNDAFALSTGSTGRCTDFRKSACISPTPHEIQALTYS